MTTHACPGRCGVEVAEHRFACVPCWRRLPAELRTSINLTYANRKVDPRSHLDAMVRASGWYRANPKATR